MIKLNGNRILKNMNIRSKINKKLYSQVHERMVKFSEDISNKEMKVPLDGSVYSIYFSKEDKLTDVANRINNSAENIQKVEFLNSSDEAIANQETNFQELIKSPFNLRLNGYQTVKYFPSLNIALNLQPKSESGMIINNYNLFLLDSLKKIMKEKEINKSLIDSVLGENKSEVEKRINELLSIYEKLFEEQSSAEKLLEKRLKDRRWWFLNLGMLFFILHAIVFYYLIYQVYGWDTIEPITYIVGNVYWIIGLGFFVMKKKKLDFSLFSSTSYKKEFMTFFGKRIGYSQKDKDFLFNEIAEIRKFKATLSKIIKH